MNDTQLLSQVGEALYGQHWQTTLSRQICVSDRSMRRWASGADKIPWGVWHDVYLELKSRTLNLDYWKKVLYDRVTISDCDSSPEGQFNADTDWLVEVHDPESGRHSLMQSAVKRSFADVRAMMKEHPGMIFKINLPHKAPEDERHEFSKMNIQRLWP